MRVALEVNDTSPDGPRSTKEYRDEQHGPPVELWPVDRLIPFLNNPRTHSPEQVAQVAASIVQFGFVNPILVGTGGVIIAGHARLLAARKLGMKEVPVIMLGHLSPA